VNAWHRLGEAVVYATSATEALKHAHLTGWNVRKTQLTTDVMVGNKQVQVAVPDQYAIVRDNPVTKGQVDVFGVVGSQYTPIQNEEHAELLDSLLAESGSAHFETAGALKGGSEVFITMKLPDDMLIGGEDRVETYIAAVNTHHGNKSFQFLVTPIRIVCANTLALAINGATASFKARHTRNATTGITAQVQDALGLTYKFVDEFEMEAQRLIETSYTNRQFDKLTEKLFPVKENASDLVKNRVNEKRATVSELFRHSATMTKIKGTKWAAFNAITEYADHYATFTGKSNDEAATRRAQLAVESISSLGQLKERTLQLLK
jgi:phage/plasmid-like protein (TIGR03299 family)